MFESESDWKQLGNVADSVLRRVAEKRMKQAEMRAAEVPTQHDVALRPPRDGFYLQLDLPLGLSSSDLASISRRYAGRGF